MNLILVQSLADYNKGIVRVVNFITNFSKISTNLPSALKFQFKL